ncbi:copper resistance B precursor [Gloeothece citriformis PCC 7424]|uniref:Copper resistance B n=1 Tax=Gloeothece citriformis (strain PCC 7424) TaxID=65393 RepID=B7KC25_GLOC7|nr:copper resistance protein B [Gloeothece citriformis]ACK68848.1 copper resistance B precursor [Gloeothece citriformis PCC 7424]
MKIKIIHYSFILSGLVCLLSVLANGRELRAQELDPKISIDPLNLNSEFIDEINTKYWYNGKISSENFQQLKIEINSKPLDLKPNFTHDIKNLSENFLFEEDSQPQFEIIKDEQNSWSAQDTETPDNTNQEDWPDPIKDSETYWLLLVDQLEYRDNGEKNGFAWDIDAWVGGDYQRIWIKTEGEIGFPEEESGEAEIQLLYGYLIDPFWDLQVGLRYDRIFASDDDRGRAFAVIGVEGLAPYLFEIETALFISENGDVSARLTAEQELLLSQKLILQPKFEINLAAQEVEEFEIGSGINDIELGLRLRYEFTRQVAPYVGINWSKKLGRTADFAEEEGESTDTLSVVGGIRLLF